MSKKMKTFIVGFIIFPIAFWFALFKGTSVAFEYAEQLFDFAEVEDKTSVTEIDLEKATVIDVVDGDTIDVILEGNNQKERVRLIGINTPESTSKIEVYGNEASQYTESQLEGKEVWLQKDVSETDQYGRLLRLVWLDIPTNFNDENEIREKMFNAKLILYGYAEPYTIQPDVTYSSYFTEFAKEAQQQRIGLWSYGEKGTTRGDFD